MLRIGFYGNCQINALALLLMQSDRCTVSFTYAVHNMREDDIAKMYTQLPTIDVLVCNNISDNFQGNPKLSLKSVLAEVQPTCRSVVVTSCYYNGYFPESVYLVDANGRHLAQYDLHMHDTRVLQYYCEQPQIPIKTLATILQSPSVVSQGMSVLMHEKSLNTLHKYEEAVTVTGRCCDVKILPYIRANYAKRRLMNTINHPTNEVLYEMCRQVGILIDIDTSMLRCNYELLGEIITPIFPCTTVHLGLNFSDTRFYMKNRLYSVEEMVAMYFNYYAKILDRDTVRRNYKRIFGVDAPTEHSPLSKAVLPLPND